MVTAEYAPLAKAGGLADMVAGLSRELHGLGHDVRVMLPAYGGRASDLPAVGPPLVSPVHVDGTHPPVQLRQWLGPAGYQGPRVYLVDCPALFGNPDIYGGGGDEVLRFALLSHCAAPLARALRFQPDVLHCHDWHTALAVLLPGSAGCRTLLTLHNVGYQGDFPDTLLAELGAGDSGARLSIPGTDRLNFLRAGIGAADALTTVSPTHATEILTPEYGHGLEDLLNSRSKRLTGILNGADYRDWNPATDPNLPAHFSREDLAGKADCRAELRARFGLKSRPVPLLGVVSRLAAQKGIDLVLNALPEFLASGQVQLAVLGAGDSQYAAGLKALMAAYPGDCVYLAGHDEAAARLIYAGSDGFLVPSRYEPCGLTQMYALRYGSVPVVRRTGGLADTVAHFDDNSGHGNGFAFRDADVGGLRWGIQELLRCYAAPAAWSTLVGNGMASDYSWAHQAPHYVALYSALRDGSL